MKIFVFGNAILQEDSQPVNMMPALKKKYPTIEFVHSDPTDEWWNGQESPLIIDTVMGLRSVKVFSSLDSFEDPNVRITPHDYDLFVDLSFLLKLKKIHSFMLIGLPQQGDYSKIFEEICTSIDSIVVQSSV